MKRAKKNMDELRRHLEAMRSHGHGPARVFEDWVALCFYALQRDDESYLEIMGRYDNAIRIDGMRPADRFAAAFACLVQAMEASNSELLGDLFMEYASDKYTGQFFTPWSVSSMMAELVTPAEGERCLDCACGAGGQLVAAGLAMRHAGHDVRKSLFMGVDISFTCCAMTAINLTLRDLPGVVVHGDSLRLLTWAGWKIVRTPLMPPRLVRMTTEEATEWMEGPVRVGLEQERAKEEERGAEEPEVAMPPKPAYADMPMFRGMT